VRGLSHDENRVRDVLSEIAQIQAFTNGITFEEFWGDRKTIRAVLDNLASIDEAVCGIPPKLEAVCKR
jgi:uncharacterized protein with HEPN domain